MFGISYGGISQLFAAQERPPALEAIAPLSVLDATATTLYPGGVLNTGFAVAWAEERHSTPNRPAPPTASTGPTNRSRKATRPAKPTRTCTARLTNLLGEIKENSTYNPAGGRPAGPDHVRAQHQGSDVHGMPVGGRADRRALRRPGGALHRHEQKWFTFTNGVHADSLDPYTFDRLYDFLELYVAHQAPIEQHGASCTPRLRPSTRRHSESQRATNHAAAGPDPGNGEVRRSAEGLRGAAGGSRAVRQRRGTSPPGGTTPRATPTPASNSPSPPSRSPARRPTRGTSGRKRHAQRSARRVAAGATPTPRTRTPRR